MSDHDVHSEQLNWFERATSKGLDVNAELDREAAQWREDWLSFSQILERAEATRPAPRVLQVAVIARPLSIRSSLLLSIAAVSLLLLLLVGWAGWSVRNHSRGFGSTDADAIAKSVTVPGLGPKMPNSAHVDGTEWSDSFDDDLQMLQIGMQLSTSRSGTDGMLSTLSWQLEQMNKAFADDSL